jgi:hypothetical protein
MRHLLYYIGFIYFQVGVNVIGIPDIRKHVFSTDKKIRDKLTLYKPALKYHR